MKTNTLSFYISVSLLLVFQFVNAQTDYSEYNQSKDIIPSFERFGNGDSLKWEFDVLTVYLADGSPKEHYTRTYDAENRRLIMVRQDWSSGKWERFRRTFYTFGPNDTLLTQKIDLFRSGNWEDYQEYSYRFNDDSKILEVFVEQWGEGVKENLSRYTYTYDNRGNQLTYLYESWDSTGWGNNTKYISAYDDESHKISNVYLNWDSTGWANIDSLKYRYDQNSGELLEETKYKWAGNGWANYQRNLNEYRSDSLVITYEIWSTDHWKTRRRHTYKFNPDGTISSFLNERWTSGTWQKEYIDTFRYDGSGNMLSLLGDRWDSGSRKHADRIVYTYDEHGNSLTGKYDIYDNGSWKAANSIGRAMFVSIQKKKTRIFNVGHRFESGFFSFILSTASDISDGNECTLFPNPVSDYVFINFNQPVTGEISVYTMQGHLIHQQPVKQVMQTSVDLSDYPSGVYLLRFSNPKGDELTRKIIVESQY